MTPNPKRGRPKLDRPAKSHQRPKKIDGSVTIVVRVTSDQLAKIDATAARKNESRSQAIRRMIDDHETA